MKIYKNKDGQCVQIYSSKPVDENFAVLADPYPKKVVPKTESQIAMWPKFAERAKIECTRLHGLGFLFFRDEDHSIGALHTEIKAPMVFIRRFVLPVMV